MQDSITKIQFKISTPDIEVASEIIQDLGDDTFVIKFEDGTTKTVNVDKMCVPTCNSY